MFIFILLMLSPLFYGAGSQAVSSIDLLPLILRYETVVDQREFVPLSPIRKRRSIFNSGSGDIPDWKIPDDYDEQKDAADHIYYKMNVTSGKKALDAHFVDIDELLKQKGVTGNSSHPLLSGSYRRAVGAKLSFLFPFYGHYMNNLTIATGGFIYIGDQTHNWLAATQYIAPLMANFDTQLNNSNIIYADDGNRFIVEWRKVQLREQTKEGNFTFQVILHKNGDIVFAYKDVPMDVTNISDNSHPVKLGISDAYLFNHEILSISGKNPPPPKRVIYEYHRIEVNMSMVQSNTVVFLEAQPTCISLTSCEACVNATLAHFSCSWCHSSKKHGGPFCTDESGLHRRRQTWIQGNCREKEKDTYCTGNDETEVDDETTATTPTTTTHEENTASETKGKMIEHGSSGWAAFVFFMGLALCVVGWFAYAYYNPHTTSGQLLIKYRPSRWHVPSSHVRYSASVHM